MTDLCNLSLDSAELQDHSRKTKTKETELQDQSGKTKTKETELQDQSRKTKTKKTKGNETKRLKQKYKNCNITQCNSSIIMIIPIFLGFQYN